MRAELIGRKVAMSQLQEAVENLKQAKDSILSTMGDAGTGKSRLIEESRATLSSQDIQWREGYCYAYVQDIPYFPLIPLLSRAWMFSMFRVKLAPAELKRSRSEVMLRRRRNEWELQNKATASS